METPNFRLPQGLHILPAAGLSLLLFIKYTLIIKTSVLSISRTLVLSYMFIRQIGFCFHKIKFHLRVIQSFVLLCLNKLEFKF